MKKLLVLLGAVALTACTPATILAGGVTNTASSVTLSGTKALNVAADAYTGIATLTKAAVDRGAFDNATLVRIGALNDQALSLLQKGNSGLTEAQRAAQLLGIIGQLRTILKTGEQR